MTVYIKREDAIDAVLDVYYNTPDIDLSGGRLEAAILNIPAADVVEIRHGRWDGEGDGYADGEIVIDVWYCSECGYCIDDGTDDPNILPNYCPNCGAYMMGENNGKCE